MRPRWILSSNTVTLKDRSLNDDDNTADDANFCFYLRISQLTRSVPRTYRLKNLLSLNATTKFNSELNRVTRKLCHRYSRSPKYVSCIYVYEISHESLVFSLYTHEPLGAWVYHENADDKWYTTRELCISILHHVIQYTEANTVNEIYARRMIGRLDVIPLNTQWLSSIPIGCIFYGVM